MTSTIEPDFDLQETLAQGTTSAARPVPAAPAYGFRARAARTLTRRIVSQVPVAVDLADGDHFGAISGDHPTLEVRRPRDLFARLGQSPMIGLGEGYMAEDWAPAPGTDLADLLAPYAARLSSLVPARLYRLRHAVMPRLRGLDENTVDGSRKNIHHHYDLSNEMFAQFLDPTLSYSCAIFDRLDTPPSQADHEAAQRKIDAVLDAAGVRAGSRVLEIGTGWGSLAIRAAQRGAVVTTLTISAQQAELARTRIAEAGVSDRVSVELRDYRDERGTYDAVVSVEMVEAVGEKYWPDYFTMLDRVLALGGRVAIQAILLEHERMLATRDTYGSIQKYIFPGGLLPSVRAIEEVLADHTSLHVASLQQVGPHYAHTLRLWRERFDDNWDEVAALGFDPTFKRMWEFYLAYCEAGFRTGYLDVGIFTLSR